MTTASTLLDRLAPPPDGSSRTTRARAWLDLHGLPTTRLEAWRYTPVDDIVSELCSARAATPGDAAGPTRAKIDELAGDHGGPRLVFVNGAPMPTLSDLDGLPAGLRWGAAHWLLRRPAGSQALPSDDPIDGFDALNSAARPDAAIVTIDAQVTIPLPLHIVHIALGHPSGTTTACHPRSEITLGPGSDASVIETFTSLDGPTVTNASTRIAVRRAAHLTYRRIQQGGADAIHIGRTRIDQAAGSTAHLTSVTTGSRIARSAIDARLIGPDATVELDGLYLPGPDQHHDTVVTVDHAASRGHSTQEVRGVIDDHGRGSFSGHVIVRPQTVGTDAHQTNRNLLLGPTARADTRPWLEIFADDVRCTHGATVGRLDADALFYLRSRGIPLPDSKSMLVAAFVAEITDAITPVSLRDRLTDALEGILGAPAP